MTQYGGKADSLKLILDTGLRVPEFYVISSKKLEQAHSPEELNNLYDEFLEWKKNDQVDIAIARSSGESEDNEQQSFAGQFLSVFDVANESTFKLAIKNITSSKASTAYSNTSTKMNIIIQRQINSKVSGVIFSINPASGQLQFVINASAGERASVVQGSEASQYFIDRSTMQIQDQIHPSGKKLHLSKTVIKTLISSILKAEQAFGTLIDLEWVVDANNVVHIVQARPITTHHMLRVWDSSNLSESFPGIVLPLTFSIAKRGYEMVYKSQAHAAGLDWYNIEEKHRVFDAMIGIFAGRMYYNLLNWYQFIGMFPANQKNQRYLDLQIQTEGDSLYLPKQKHNFIFKSKFWLRLAKRTITLDRELKKFKNNYVKVTREVDQIPLAKDPFLLLERFTILEQRLLPHWGRTVDNDFFVMVFNGLITSMLAKSQHKNDREIAHRIGLIGNVVSSNQAIELYKIAEHVANDPLLSDDFKNKNLTNVANNIFSSNTGELVTKYMQTYGHRFARDQLIESKNPQLDIHKFVQILWAYSQNQNEFQTRLNSAKHQNKSFDNTIVKSLPIYKRPAYHLLKRSLAKRLRIREENRLLRGRIYAYFRESFPLFGDCLVQMGVLEKSEDVFYLQIDELLQYMNGSAPVAFSKETIRARKAEYASYKKIDNPPIRFVTTGLPYNDYVAAWKAIPSDTVVSDSLKGVISSPGTIEGKALVLDEPILPDEPFDILVVKSTDPGWTPILALAKGVIVEHGGILSHAAIITRELGIPSIIGVSNATNIITSGKIVRINSATSTVQILT